MRGNFLGIFYVQDIGVLRKEAVHRAKGPADCTLETSGWLRLAHNEPCS